jgi:putative salt-induced outer membrane protein
MPPRRTFATVLVAGLWGSALAAQGAKKPPPTELSGDLGVVDVSGNTSTSTVNANARYVRRMSQWEFKENLGAVYGKTAGVESSNLLRLGTRADYALADHFAVYGLGAYDRDRFAGIRSRFAEGAGVVWKVIATDGDQLNVEGGYQYTQQKNLVGADHNFSALRLASDWKHSFTKAAYFYQGLEYVPDLQDSQDYRINTETDVVAPLSTHVGIKFSYVVRFANAPPLNAAGTAPLQKTDRILSAGVQVTY